MRVRRTPGGVRRGCGRRHDFICARAGCKLAREGLRAPPAVPPRFTQVPVAPQPTAGPMREEPALNSTSKSTLEACKHTVSVFRPTVLRVIYTFARSGSLVLRTWRGGGINCWKTPRGNFQCIPRVTPPHGSPVRCCILLEPRERGMVALLASQSSVKTVKVSSGKKGPKPCKAPPATRNTPRAPRLGSLFPSHTLSHTFSARR